MRFGTWLLALLAAALLATVLIPRDLPAAWRPDLFLILAAFAALRAQPRAALGLAWLAGLAEDLLSAGPAGEFALLCLAAAAAILWARGRADSRSPLTVLALVWAAAAAAGCVAAWAACHEGLRPGPAAFHGVMTRSLATACLAIPVFAFLDRRRFFSRRFKHPVSRARSEQP